MVEGPRTRTTHQTLRGSSTVSGMMLLLRTSAFQRPSGHPGDGLSDPSDRCARRNCRGTRSFGALRSPRTENISLLAISVSHLEKHWKQQRELSLGLPDEKRRPGTKKGMARWTADRAIDVIRDRFGWDAVGYASVMLGASRSVPDEFRELAEKDLRSHAADDRFESPDAAAISAAASRPRTTLVRKRTNPVRA
jgi:hypothetical protein